MNRHLLDAIRVTVRHLKGFEKDCFAEEEEEEEEKECEGRVENFFTMVKQNLYSA